MRRNWQTVCIVLLVMILTACSSSAEGEAGSQTYSTENVKKVSDVSGTVRLSLAGWQLENGIDPVTGQETTGFNQYIDDTFKKMYPNIKLEITQVPWENAQAKQRAQLMSGDVDVIYTGGAFAAQYYNEGLLRDLDDLIEKDKTFDPGIYLEGIWNSSYSTRSPDGEHQYGIPAILGKRVTIYDKQIFADWGVEPLSEVPTPEEILEKAKKMTGTDPKTGEQTYGLWFSGNSINQSTFVALSYYFGEKGGEGTLDKPGDIKWSLNTPGMVKALEWMGEAAKLAPPAFVNGSGEENFGLEKNNVAMVLDNSGTTIMSEFRANGDKELLDRYVPVMNIGKDGTGWVAVDPFIMAKKAQNPEASWEVMKFLASYDTQKWAYLNFDYTPTLKKADFIEENNGYVKNAMKMADITKPTLMDEANPFYNSEIVPAVNGYLSESANGKSPDAKALLERLQSRAEDWSANQK